MSAPRRRAVFLAGFMGSGKNTVGHELARRLGWIFVDLDARIEARERMPIPDIFRLHGEPTFRAAETAALHDLLADVLDHPTVVALGGGAFTQENNRQLLHAWPTVFLDAPVQELWERCCRHELELGVARPLRGDLDQFTELHAHRLPFYRQASVVIETSGKRIADICNEITHALQLTTNTGDQSANTSPAPSSGTSAPNPIISKTPFS